MKLRKGWNWKRKAITTLMASFLLVSFAVAVGVVVMNIARAQIETEAECAVDVNLHLATLNGEQQLCYNYAIQALEFTTENGLNIAVQGMIVNIIGEERAETFDLANAAMGRAATFIGRIPFDSISGGKIRQVRFTPKVNLYNQEEICTESSFVIEYIPNC